MDLSKPKFSYSTCGLFTQNKKRIQKLNKTKDSRYICLNNLDKTCFQHDMAYGDFKYFPERTSADKVLRDKAFIIAKNPKYDGYQRGRDSMVYKF